MPVIDYPTYEDLPDDAKAIIDKYPEFDEKCIIELRDARYVVETDYEEITSIGKNIA